MCGYVLALRCAFSYFSVPNLIKNLWNLCLNRGFNNGKSIQNLIYDIKNWVWILVLKLSAIQNVLCALKLWTYKVGIKIRSFFDEIRFQANFFTNLNKGAA